MYVNVSLLSNILLQSKNKQPDMHLQSRKCPILLQVWSNKFTLLCLALIGLKSQWRHWLGARKTTTWLNSGEQSQGKKNSDAVNYAVVEFLMDVRSVSLLLVLHPSSQVYRERYYWGREGSSRKDDEEERGMEYENGATVEVFKGEGKDQTDEALQFYST